jgi:ABC-type multidrug transport system fused ATPase/permease subunit
LINEYKWSQLLNEDHPTNQKMRMKAFILIVVSVVGLAICLVSGAVYYTYSYNVRMGQYAQLADDASTAQKKLEHLEKYKERVQKYIYRNEARYLFKKERLTRDNQLEILDTLIQRLEEAKLMKPDTMQYQQAMLQITGQEFDHVLSAINSIFRACWLRQSGMAVFALWFSWIIWLILFAWGFVLAIEI